MVQIIVRDSELLPADIVLTIENGNGFKDNAKAAGWVEYIPPSQDQLGAALQKILDQQPGSAARLQAQKEMQLLEQSTVPNPESPLQFLIGLVRKSIESLLIDQNELEQLTQAALAKVEEEVNAKLQARMKVEIVAAE